MRYGVTNRRSITRKAVGRSMAIMGSLPLLTGNLLCFSLVSGLEPRYRHNMVVATCLPEDLDESKAFPIIRETNPMLRIGIVMIP